jgi:23S rRNA U2552 (ribose-2'-O)-methylase RlmE/FtsJ
VTFAGLADYQERFRLIRPGARILDLGAAPGSWSQFCLRTLAGSGLVVGVDLNEPAFQQPTRGAEFRFLRGDLFTSEVEARLAEWGPSTWSERCRPHTSGSHLVDDQASLELAGRAWAGPAAGGAARRLVFRGEGTSGCASSPAQAFCRHRAANRARSLGLGRNRGAVRPGSTFPPFRR